VQGDVPRKRPSPRILVVEDELLIALVAEQIVVDLGCTVIGPAPSVTSARALIDGGQPDFAFLHVNLGGERTTPIAEALRGRSVPFAHATGYDRSQLPEEVHRDAPHLGKPLDHKLLVGALAGGRPG
jgi:CheY-like chemotaxis protein